MNAGLGQYGELVELVERWRARARELMDDAERSERHSDIVRLTAMASTLEWASSDLTFWFELQSRARALLTDARKPSEES